MGSRHLKRFAVPRSWSIAKKEHTWAVKPSPGPHSKEDSVPLLILVRDILKYSRTSKEAKRIIREGSILVDKKARKDYKFPVGLMDIVEIPATKDRFIVMLDRRGKLVLEKIKVKETNLKPCKIVGKQTVRGGDLQLNFHDGRNYLVKIKDPKKPKEDVYRTKDTVLFDLNSSKPMRQIDYKEGNLALVIAGSHRGEVARIEEIQTVKNSKSNIVVLSSNSKKFRTLDDYVFMVGKTKSEVPGVSA